MLTTLKGESWKTISKDDWRPNECYHVSSFGRVFSEKHKNRKLRFKLSNINGYEAFSAIRINKTTNLVYIHKIVAELFLENPEQKQFVIHKDHNKTNNCIENLAWATRKEMVFHNKSNPLVIAGKLKRERNKPYAKLSVGKVKMIKRKLFNPKHKTRMRLIAKQFGISEMQLYRIKSGKNWGSVTDF
ncbi:HNH endonuclease [Ichthyenterobacterium magnum]|uniref:HNH endonuclease n=1 Tax=Ichthyenterobacterium magnum TaxID=1230530 RepID=A0A420DXL0_9FLAO|nr:HNH endonuclease [Ichthyenterobacterium magnum]RKE98978.1 HNH endonuclease [Ichthyenterobacterium magnum]